MTLPKQSSGITVGAWFDGVCMGCIAEAGDMADAYSSVLAKEILEERSGTLKWLYTYFSTFRRPMTPIEFFKFWVYLDQFERNEFVMFAIERMPVRAG
jgi:hypothetical protein